MGTEDTSKVKKMLDKLPIKVVSNGHGLIIYKLKNNPGVYEEIGRLDWEQSVGLYMNVKNEVEGTLFLRARELENLVEEKLKKINQR